MRILSSSGELEGKYQDNLFCFEGIPYAKAKRFCPPRPYRWNTVLCCKNFGPQAIQVHDQTSSPEEYSEDCLNLNIYTPDLSGNLPVVVYIHGGAFQGGSNRQRSPSVMLRGGHFVYVAINYRLGALGFLYLGQLLGPEYQPSGNLGLLDQALALQWIHQNISRFGGDPQKITVMGESAGAKSISTLLLLPSVHHCFHQVCLASGAMQSIRDIHTAHQVALRFWRHTGLTRPEDLLSAPVSTLMDAQRSLCNGPESICFFGPVADDVTLPVNWNKCLETDRLWKGKVLLGSCRHEAGYYPDGISDFLGYAPSLVQKLFGKNALIAQQEFERLVAQEPYCNNTHSKTALWIKIISDYMYRCYSRRLADALAKNGSTVWLYSMEYGTAEHCSDQNLAFQPSPTSLQDPISQTLSEEIYASYVHFFCFGTPCCNKIPYWPALTADSPHYLCWDNPVRIEKLPQYDVLDNFPDCVYQL